MYRAYAVAGTVVSPFILPVLLASHRGRIRISERFGDWGELPELKWWFHGASVGEVSGLLPVMNALRQSDPAAKQLLTTTSPTGLDRGRDAADALRLAPLDVPWCVSRALRGVRVEHFVVSETEVWPVLFTALQKRGVRCSIVNGRISDYTVEWYRRLRPIFRSVMSNMSSVVVTSSEQVRRFEALGVVPERITVSGNSKYDTTPTVNSDQAREQLRQTFFPGIARETPIIVLGSIRPGEEGYWWSAFSRMWGAGHVFKVIVAPRHSEKFPYFLDRVKELNRQYATWSTVSEPQEERRDVLLLDVYGQLEAAYSTAQLCFIGATLVDVGGHNPLEAAMYSVPVCVGPYTSVIAEVVADMQGVDGIIDLTNEESIHSVVERVCRRDPELTDLGMRGATVWEKHRGATARIVKALTPHTGGV